MLQDPDDEDLEDMDAATAAPGEVRTGADAPVSEQSRDEGLKPADIDAYWLQRNITKAYGSLDENDAVRKTEEVFNALQVNLANALTAFSHIWQQSQAEASDYAPMSCYGKIHSVRVRKSLRLCAEACAYIDLPL